MFLSIGCFNVTLEQEYRAMVGDPVTEEFLENYPDRHATADGLNFRRQGHMYRRLRPMLRLDNRLKFEPPLDESVFGVVQNSMAAAVNDDENLRKNLRWAAKELVRRRRARQAMGGPRWEAFIGNMSESGNGDGEGQGRN